LNSGKNNTSYWKGLGKVMKSTKYKGSDSWNWQLRILPFIYFWSNIDFLPMLPGMLFVGLEVSIGPLSLNLSYHTNRENNTTCAIA
jgi:hypothetical protein